MFRDWSIRWRLFIFVLAGAGLILTAVISYGNYQSLQVLEAELEGKAWQLSHATANRIIAVEKAMTKIAGGLSAVIEMKLPSSEEDILLLMEQLVSENEELSGVAVAFEPNRSYIASAAGSLAVRRDGRVVFRDTDSTKGLAYVIEDWYALPRSLHQPYWSEPYSVRNAGRDVLMVTYSMPIYTHSGSGNFLGVVKCDLSLEWLQDLLLSLPLEQSGYAFLLSQNGTYISHPRKDFILKENIFSTAEEQGNTLLRKLGRDMIKGRSGFIRFDDIVRDANGWLMYQPIRSTGWVLGMFFHQDIMTAKVVDLRNRQIAIGIFGFFILIPVMLIIARSITQPLKELDISARLLAAGDLDAPIPAIRGRDEVARLTSTFSAMRSEIKAYLATLEQAATARERVESELRIARDIQMSLVPQTFQPAAHVDGFALHAYMRPAREVGGDFYDFFMIDDEHLCIAIGDVSGKGVPAALFMAVSRTLLRAFLQAGHSPGSGLARLNDEMAQNNEYCMFVTIVCLIVHLPSGSYRFANGGHNLPFVIHSNGSIVALPKTKGAALGAMEGVTLQEAEGALSPGDMLFLYTDGVTEAMNRQGGFFGETRTIDVLSQEKTGDCLATIDAVTRAVDGFADGAEQSDDITMLAFLYLGIANDDA